MASFLRLRGRPVRANGHAEGHMGMARLRHTRMNNTGSLVATEQELQQIKDIILGQLLHEHGSETTDIKVFVLSHVCVASLPIYLCWTVSQTRFFRR